MSISLIYHYYTRLESVGSNESNDPLISIIRGRVVVDGVSGSRDGIGGEIGVGDRGVELLGRVNLGHIGTERSDLTVGSAEWCVVVTGDDKDGLCECSSIHHGRGSDGVYDQLLIGRLIEDSLLD
jgi:hypothetical protein